MTWHELGRIALLLLVWAALAMLRGPGCPLSWRLAAEAATAVGVAWFASDGIAMKYFPHRDKMEPWELGRQLGRVSLAVAVGLVGVWGLAAIVLCRAGA